MSELGVSYQWCREVCRRSQSSFRASFKLLDAPRRRAMYALYAFSRISDDLSDATDVDVFRRPRLTLLRNGLAQLSNGNQMPSDSNHELLWPALADTVNRFRIPVSVLDDIVQGVMLDIDHHHFRDWEELETYCYHVASAVGLACTYIWRKTDHIPSRSAIDCGVAFQLTNILRDVAEDARMGRVYIPRLLFLKHRTDLSRWLAGVPNGGWEPMLDEVAEEARFRFERGWDTVDSLTPRSQRMFSLMWRSYRQLLDEVVANKHQLWRSDKVRLPLRRRVNLIATHYIPPLYQRIPAPSFREESMFRSREPSYSWRT